MRKQALPASGVASASGKEAAGDAGPLPAPPWVKICGLREPVHAAAAAAAGADLLGFIFAPGRRRVTPEQARECIGAARAAAGARTVVAVGVFVDAAPAEMNAVAEAAGIDLLQLHGDEPPDVLAALRRPAVKAVRPPDGTSPDAFAAMLRWYGGGSREPLFFLVDGHAPDAAGGTGVRADWRLAARLVDDFSIALAGGLDVGNVADAIAAVRPVGVDVSSGVEIEGRKDSRRITAFVVAAREEFDALAARDGAPVPR